MPHCQAIEEAIARKLPRVEAGAQGEHKMQRGYLPALTYSAHWMADPTLRHAVDKFLGREEQQVKGGGGTEERTARNGGGGTGGDKGKLGEGGTGGDDGERGGNRRGHWETVGGGAGRRGQRGKGGGMGGTVGGQE